MEHVQNVQRVQMSDMERVQDGEVEYVERMRIRRRCRASSG